MNNSHDDDDDGTKSDSINIAPLVDVLMWVVLVMSSSHRHRRSPGIQINLPR